ncbi:MAG: hypothetical protein LAO79_28540, partial [Acidobacteriia bacterium]|nr:hypothetical protein [Terriglobia bacterium]
DEDGYLFLTGRIKEIINRGGEKISPAEIDEVLNAHPAVAEALAFSMPDERLGEDVAAAVVLRNTPSPGMETELRDFAASRLVPSKVPRRFVFLDEIPKAATGKALRIGLADRLGLTNGNGDPHTAPPSAGDSIGERRDGAAGHDSTATDSVTMVLLHIWEDVLATAPIGANDDFFDLGGDSLMGARILGRIEETFGKKLTLPSFFEAPTVARMARLLTESPEKGYEFEGSKVIPIRTSGSLPPLFVIGPHPLFRNLVLQLPKQQPVYGLTFPDQRTLSVPFRLEKIAERQLAAIRRFRPQGSFALMGWCADGLLAYEMARMLEARGEEVPLVTMIDAFNPRRWEQGNLWTARTNRLRFHLENLQKRGIKGAAAYGAERFRMLQRRTRRALWRAAYHLQLVTDRRVGDRLRIPEQIVSIAMNAYDPGPYGGRVLLLRAQNRPSGTFADPAAGWKHLIKDLHVADVTGDHVEMFAAGNVHRMAQAIAKQTQHAEAAVAVLTSRG